MKYSILQASSSPRSNRFAIINGTMSPAGYPVGYQGKDWDYLEHEGRRVLNDLLINDAREICDKLNNGADVADFFIAESGGYGSAEHQACDDAWLYQDCPGAW